MACGWKGLLRSGPITPSPTDVVLPPAKVAVTKAPGRKAPSPRPSSGPL
jgi:hypothetical protein